jgi:hypothetical protein
MSVLSEKTTDPLKNQILRCPAHLRTPITPDSPSITKAVVLAIFHSDQLTLETEMVNVRLAMTQEFG